MTYICHDLVFPPLRQNLPAFFYPIFCVVFARTLPNEPGWTLYRFLWLSRGTQTDFYRFFKISTFWHYPTHPIHSQKNSHIHVFLLYFCTRFAPNQHRLKIEFAYFREGFDLSSRVTGVIWEVFTWKYFFFKILTDLDAKTSILSSKNTIFELRHIQLTSY